MDHLLTSFGQNDGSRSSETLNYFEKPSINFSEEMTWNQDLYPINPITKATKRIEFILTPSPYFTDLSETIIAFTTKLTLANGDPVPPAVPADDPAKGPAPNPDPPAKTPYAAASYEQLTSSTLFKNIEVRIGSVNLTSSIDHYPIIAYLLNLLNKNRSVKDSKMERSGYYRTNKVSNFNVFDLDGFSKRYEFTKESKLYELETPIYHGFFQQPRLLLPMVECRVSLELNSPELAINTAVPATVDNSSFNFTIEKMCLRIKRVKLLDSLQSRIETQLSKSVVANFPHLHYSCKSLSIPKGCTKFFVSDLLNSPFLPRYVLLAMSTATAAAGNFRESCFKFEHFNLTEASLFIQNQRIPSLSYKFDFSKNQYLSGWTQLFGSDMNYENVEVGIDRKAWADEFTILHFGMCKVGVRVH